MVEPIAGSATRSITKGRTESSDLIMLALI
jgi:hypothetical protein